MAVGRLTAKVRFKLHPPLWPWAVQVSNLRPPACKAGALPTELTAGAGDSSEAGGSGGLAIGSQERDKPAVRSRAVIGDADGIHGQGQGSLGGRGLSHPEVDLADGPRDRRPGRACSGASRGLGRAVAEALGREGARVAWRPGPRGAGAVAAGIDSTTGSVAVDTGDPRPSRRCRNGSRSRSGRSRSSSSTPVGRRPAARSSRPEGGSAFQSLVLAPLILAQVCVPRDA